MSGFRSTIPFVFLLGAPVIVAAQSPVLPTEPVAGIRDKRPAVHALRDARVVVAPGRVLERATVVLRDGLIEAVGTDVQVPPGARLWEMDGRTVYPGLIEPFYEVEAGDTGREREGAAHWNPLVRPERRAADALPLGEKESGDLRELGFTTAHVVPDAGVFRGWSAVAQLGDGGAGATLVAPEVVQVVAFERSGYQVRRYPSSLMGCIALVRQTLSDAGWYRRSQAAYRSGRLPQRPEANRSLAALSRDAATPVGPLLFRAEDELDFARATAVASEFGAGLHFLGNGYGYRVAGALSETGATVIVPLGFPEKPDLRDPAAALAVSTERLQHWEQAPGNAAALAGAGVPVALTTHGLKNPEKRFWQHVRQAVQRGLSVDGALAALTTVPAALAGLSHRLGTVEPGKAANLLVTTGDPFSDGDALVRQVWVDGVCFPQEADRRFDPTGTWTFHWGEGREAWPATATVEGEWPDFRLEIETGTEPGDDGASDARGDPVKIELDGTKLVFQTEPSPEPDAALGGMENAQLAAHFRDGRLVGVGGDAGSDTFTWSATRTGPVDAGDEDGNGDADDDVDGEGNAAPFSGYPAGAYAGRAPAPRAVVVRGATVWTSGPRGRLEEADLVVDGSVVVAVGRELAAPEGALVIDGRGKHVTPGLVDAHSHTAISRGINEATHAVTAEVRVGDVVDPTDINLYRQLAGGLTCANLLHGSANPIGGQNQVIKLRWGSDADGLRFRGAKPGIKFALGENVKQSNWGDRFTTRYPQTRMGVEQIFRDTFIAALDYGEEKQRGGPGFRRDLRLETVLEILEGERIVHIHSYRQDEILMFVRLAQEFGFTVGTFQHVLEGYKVADAIAEIGAGGSSFSDWWAYKFEVYDAIPHNGALLHRAGVVTSFNSDDSELARRLNTEAAKAVKYGGVSEEEALKFVTLNPAIQLRIDDRVGSLEPGKDADFVIWSDHPLSSYARAEQTWIDGARYFDLGSDSAQQLADRRERDRLVAKVLGDGKNGEDGEGEDEDDSEAGESPGPEPDDLRFLFSDWRSYQEINFQPIYHDGHSLHACTGAFCDFAFRRH